MNGKRMHVCNEDCDRRHVRESHQRARMNRRDKVKAKLHGKRPKVRSTGIAIRKW